MSMTSSDYICWFGYRPLIDFAPQEGQLGLNGIGRHVDVTGLGRRIALGIPAEPRWR
jgi:hypothetical protein